jgi:hypothetical protein
LKSLARELRNDLFAIRDGALFTGTYSNHSIMDEGMIDAFDKAVENIAEP